MNQKELHDTLKEYGQDILKSLSFQKSKKYIQHGDFSVWGHSLHVAGMSLWLGRKLPIRVSERELVRGALLHDYFLYDWHKKRVGLNEIRRPYRMHGFTHPLTALRNARRDFKIGTIEEEIIKKHMWPLTMHMPRCREAWIVTIADKYCSLLETLRLRKGDLRG